MESALMLSLKKMYKMPEVKILVLDFCQDVICNSQEGNDNDFDAGGLGDL